MAESRPANRRLRDCLRPGIVVLFVGINPGLRSAETGHHFAGYSNRFWKLLYESELVDRPLTYREDRHLPEWGLGLTNIISRCSAGIDVLDRLEYRQGVVALEQKVRRYQPHFVALLGVTIFRMLCSTGTSPRGAQPLGTTGMRLAGVPVFLLPNPSGRNAHYSYAAMLAAFRALRLAIAHVRPRNTQVPAAPHDTSRHREPGGSRKIVLSSPRRGGAARPS